MITGLKDIKIGQGIGSIVFGMTKEELLKLAGKPDEIEKYEFDDSDDNQAEAWHYDDMELSVSFEQVHDWKLTSIAISSPDYVLEGRKLIGLSQEEVVQEVKNMNLGAMEIEESSSDEDTDLSVISIDESALNLWFDQGLLTEIQWGILGTE